jgi:4'-phosphopantetheinyl transferase
VNGTGTASSVLRSALERLCVEHARDRGQDAAAAFVSITETARLEPVWLGPRERERLACLRVAKRRRDWLAGRRAAKIALARLLGDEARGQLDVLPAGSGAPVVHGTANPLAGVGVSLVHSHDLAGALAWRGDGAGPGLDLERVQPVPEGVLSLALDAAELAYVRGCTASARDMRALRLWTAKEAVLKSRGVGLRWPLRSVHVHPAPWRPAWSAEAVEPGTGAASAFEVVTAARGGHVVAVAFPIR